VGICVSGGGLRAASFGLGALQALQQERGLLRGSGSARFLSAVSGGSYIAGAYTLLNCSSKFQSEGGEAGAVGTAPGSGVASPFAPGSPESDHLRRHSRYMLEDGGAVLSAKFGFRIVANLVAVLALLGFAGVYLGSVAFAIRSHFPSALDSPDGIVWLQWVMGVACAASLAYMFRQTGLDAIRPGTSVWVRGGFVLALAVGLLGSCSLVVRLEAVPLLRSPQWALDHAGQLAAGLGVLVLVVGAVALLSHRFHHVAFLQRLTRFGNGLLTLRLLQAIGVLVVSWWAVAVYDQVGPNRSPAWVAPAVLFFLAAPKFVSIIVDRISPHYVYRDLLNRCFSVIRVGRKAERPHDPRGVKLSDLAPPGGPGSFPELMICAAVNVSDIGATPAGSNVLSLIFTPHRMSIPAIEGADLPVDLLERLERPLGLPNGWGPALNLSSAVAMTGAAVSPAMGRKTRSDLRALFAALNIRLGVWLPNLLKEEVRRKIGVRDPKIRVGTTELVKELFGFHSERWDEIYVTDGGHYDNLGLVELLRKRCEEIWCIDASGDRPGRATALAEAILTASGELGAQVDIDLDAFAPTPDSPAAAPTVHSTHVSGRVTYADGSTARLTVVKLGICATTPSALKEYRRTDRRFPYHSTLKQVYRANRFDAYRQLGWASTRAALV
jgi:hypothetical protein